MRRLPAIVLLAAAAQLQARTAVAPLEAEPASARVAALGGSVAGLDEGEGWELDPAALADAPVQSLRLNEALLPAELQRQAVEGTLGYGAEGGLGWRLSHSSYGSIAARDESGAVTGSLQPWRGGAGVGWGWAAGWGLSLGSSLGAFYQDLGAGSGDTGILAGLGARWAWMPSQVLSLGLQSATGSPLERVIVGAGGMLPWGLRYSLQESGEQSGQAWIASAGLEKGLGLCALRLGWRQGLGAGDNTLSGFSSGLGLTWRGWTLDYAFVPLGGLGMEQRLSLGWHPFAGGQEAATQGKQEASSEEAVAPLLPPEAVSAPLPPPLDANGRPLPVTGTPQPAPQPTPALQLEFKLPDTEVEQAFQAEDEGKFKQAVAKYQEAIKADAADTRAWMGLGKLYWAQGQRDYAIQCYEQVLRLNPEDAELKAWLDKAKAARK